jgi:hypothetical protein
VHDGSVGGGGGLRCGKGLQALFSRIIFWVLNSKLIHVWVGAWQQVDCSDLELNLEGGWREVRNSSPSVRSIYLNIIIYLILELYLFKQNHILSPFPLMLLSISFR